MNPALMPGRLRLGNSFDLTHAPPVGFKRAESRHLILVPDG
jgi:hypothetical protein